MASSRRTCSDCKKNLSKSAYYNHLPCSKSTKNLSDLKSTKNQDYVLCGHCNKRVSRRTFNEHRHLQPIASNTDVVPNYPAAPQSEDEAEVGDYFDAEDEIYFSNSEPGSDENTSSGESQDEGEDEFEYCQDEEEEPMHDNSQIVPPESKALVLFLMLWQTIYKVSDAGIIMLLKFLRLLISTLGKITKMEYLSGFAEHLPTSMYMVKTWLGFADDDFDKYVPCPKCHTLYDLKDCTIRKPNGRVVSKKCTHVKYPNHPHRNKRNACGTVLMKTMRSKNGSLFLHPKRLYCYKNIAHSIRNLITKPGFLDQCETWRNASQDQDCMRDVFDGHVWKQFKDDDGSPYFSLPGNLGLMLNVDWFQPYKHTSYSCGVMYLVVMNLPRHERFKRENVIIAGIIPGPKEPKGNINSYLQPFVDDLNDLWGGVIIEDKGLPSGMIKIRAALLALCCDVPASRKCGGFAGHSARRGCSKCSKEFPSENFNSKPNFSGFDKENWEPRTNALHRVHANSARNANSPSQLRHVIRQAGARYSALYQLQYYDAVRFLVIDPMHCLFLGIAKNMLKLWKTNGLLQEKDFNILQRRVDSVVPPPEVGRIPTKISTGFSGFTADQWKNWVCYYSLFALKGILPAQHYELWVHFVSACRQLCSKGISINHCSQAEEQLVKFCKGFERMYGPELCTPNMHLSCHLGDCIRDYGPVYGFWCFSFERFNGIMGSYHKNNHNISVQLMRKFLRDGQLRTMAFPEHCKELFEMLPTREEGSLADTLHTDLASVSPVPPVKRTALDGEECDALTAMYREAWPDKDVTCLRLCDTYKRVHLNGVICRSARTVGVIVKCANGELRPAKVRRFLRHDAVIKFSNSKRRKETSNVAEVEFLGYHPERHSRYPAPLEVWSKDTDGRDCVFVSQIQAQCILVEYKVKFSYGKETVNVIIPLVGRFIM